MPDKTLFITGASSGIGAATARAAARDGWAVGLFARSADTVAALADEIGDLAMALPGDATDLAAQTEAMAQFADRFGGIDAVFANAGTGLSTSGTEDGDPAEWQSLLDLNIMGLLYTAKAAIPHLKKTRGHVVLTGSAAGRIHIKGSIYGASKWFVHGFGGNLADEMRDWGGRCTVIAPGMVDTAFFDTPKPDKLKAEDVAAAVMYTLSARAHVAVREILLMPQN